MKPTIPTLFLAATLCASALVTPPARAQDYSFPGYDYIGVGNMATGYAAQSAAYDYADEVARRNGKNTGRKTSSPRGADHKKTKVARALTTYRESPAVSKRVLGQFTSYLAKQTISKVDVDKLRRDFEDDMLGRWAKEVAADGLKRGDVADAMTAYWVANWQMANSVMTIRRTQVQGVRRQFAGILASNPAFAKLPDAGRQEMAESFIYNQILPALMNDNYFSLMRGETKDIGIEFDQALLQRLSIGRAARFKKEMGLDLHSVKLTDAGFAATA